MGTLRAHQNTTDILAEKYRVPTVPVCTLGGSVQHLLNLFAIVCRVYIYRFVAAQTAPCRVQAVDLLPGQYSGQSKQIYSKTLEIFQHSSAQCAFVYPSREHGIYLAEDICGVCPRRMHWPKPSQYIGSISAQHCTLVYSSSVQWIYSCRGHLFCH
jgi:hypothetical protein